MRLTKETAVVGLKVRCVSAPFGGSILVPDREYEITKVFNEYGDYYVNLKDSNGRKTEGWYLDRFELIKNSSTAKAANRDASGRFVPVSKAAPVVKLKPGSLYSIKRKNGRVVARYRKPAVEDYLVFSIHKKPFLVRKTNVGLANKDEVQQYLSNQI